MKDLKSGYVFLSVLLTIALSGTFAVAEYHHVEDCTVCHYSGNQEGTECNDCPNLMLVRCEIETPNSGPMDVVFTGPYERSEEPYDGICEVCHTETKYYRNDGGCPNPPCDQDDKHLDYGSGNCISCHKHAPSEFGHGGAEWGPDCEACHDHTATPDWGWVTIFGVGDHDDAWGGAYEVYVDCSTCHDNNLLAVHGVDSDPYDHCSACHDSGNHTHGLGMDCLLTPRDTLEPWDGSCQQGDCHTAFHEDSTEAHWPFADPTDYEANCNRCHDQSSWAVDQDSCMYGNYCHTTYGPGDYTPPVTTTNALPSYVGPANIDFSITDNGASVGIGRTFYKLDGGPETPVTNLFVSALDPDPHVLEYWSKDQAGNVESPTNSASFTIVEDTEAPTTDSDAVEGKTYYHVAVITLTADDNGTLGVKDTYFSLNGDDTQTGTRVHIPGASGTIEYTLRFWSEDWSGNIEDPEEENPENNIVTFTVTAGTGTIRLVWGDSDEEEPDWLCSVDPDAWADWYIRIGGPTGWLVASGGDGCYAGPWSGVNNITVPVSPTPYFVRIDWWHSYYEFLDQTDFSNVEVTTPGQIIRLRY